MVLFVMVLSSAEMRFAAVVATLLIAPALAPDRACAQAAGIRVLEVEGIRVDGSLRDWGGAHFAVVGRGPDASMRVALGHDARGLYVAAQVWDDRLVRTPHPGNREDAVIVTLATGRGHRTVADIHVFAGVSGRSAASVGIARRLGGRPRPVANARAVEGPNPRGRGYIVEAFIPFRSIPNGRRWERAHGNLRLRDVDSEAHPEVESEPSLVEVDADHLENLVPIMPSGGAAGALETFLDARGLGAARPTHDLRGDVRGGEQPERVYLVGRYVLVTGPDVQGGGYAYHELAIDRARDVRSAELRDLTGDGKAELVVVIRQRNRQGERDLWQVIDLSGERMRELFGVEVRKEVRGEGSVEARVRIVRGRGRGRSGLPQIEVRAHRARGLDRESYRETPADDVEPMLLPWGPIRSRRYRWDGNRFVRAAEQRNPRYRPPEPHAQGGGGGGDHGHEEPAPAPSGPSIDQLLAAFRRQQGIRRGARPRFRLQANLAGDRARETVRVYGRHLVAVGPGIQNGTSWLYYEIPAPSDEHLLDVTAADVTGDRRAELLFRIRQDFGEVQREVLLVHQLTGRGFPRILQVEVARREGSNRIENQVSTRGGRLRISPGRARGWNAQTYRFSRSSDDSAEPLLLPWQDRPVTYRLRGGRLQR